MGTIVLTGGGSAGHCTPHLALLPYLKEYFDKIYYIGSKNGIEKDIIEKENIPYFSVPCIKFKRKITLDNLSIPFVLHDGIKKAGKIIDQIKPDVVFSKGGYVSLPTVIACKKRKIPVIAHESDYTVGLANRISANYCKKILTAFPETAKNIKNGEYIGAPIRRELFNASKEKALLSFGFDGKKPVLTVIGGSLGAKKINEALRKALDELLPKFDVIHLCGKGNVLDKNKCKGYFQAEYISNIEDVFSVTDVCVSRAGSNALFELMSLKIPCVIVPLPKGISRGDQLLNALYFEKLGLVSVLYQNALTPYSLINYVNSVYANRFNIQRNFNLNPINDKSPKIADILHAYAKH